MVKLNWKNLLPIFSLLFVAAVGYFLFGALKAVDWSNVLTSLQEVSYYTLFTVIVMTALNYFILSSYDYLGFKYLRKKPVPFRVTFPSAIVSYAFNFNLGAIIGGLGFRIRIYRGWKVPGKLIPFAALFAVITTWTGYTLLLSLALLAGDLPRNSQLPLPEESAVYLGMIGLLLIAIYLYSCKRGKVLKIKSKNFRLPKLSTGFIQIGLSSCQWLLASSILFFLLREFGAQLEWSHVFFTYLVASIGGVIARIPAGVGVIEAIFLKMLPEVPPTIMLAALLSFRAVYFLLPLALSVPGYLLIEYLQKRRPDNFLPGRQKKQFGRQSEGSHV